MECPKTKMLCYKMRRTLVTQLGYIIDSAVMWMNNKMSGYRMNRGRHAREQETQVHIGIHAGGYKVMHIVDSDERVLNSKKRGRGRNGKSQRRVKGSNK